eukprot:Sspe_Gene.117308::Locus_108337_Transcript_1_1_Confidence_1.000_Length_787::g.117308::m.117308
MQCTVDSLYFPLEPLVDCSTVVNILQLRNTTADLSIQYKVKSTHSSYVIAQPSLGIITPGGTAEVEVRWNSEYPPLSPTDFSNLVPPEIPRARIEGYYLDLPPGAQAPPLQPTNLRISFAYPRGEAGAYNFFVETAYHTSCTDKVVASTSAAMLEEMRRHEEARKKRKQRRTHETSDEDDAKRADELQESIKQLRSGALELQGSRGSRRQVGTAGQFCNDCVVL